MDPIGKQIKDELARQERSVSWFASKLSCHRTNIYDIFARENIDTVLLIRISRILRHNFFRALADEFDKGTTQHKGTTQDKGTTQPASSE